MPISFMRNKSKLSARAAWMAIAKKRGLRPSQVRAAHTATKWVWKRR